MSGDFAFIWFLSADYNRRRPRGLMHRLRIARRFPRRFWRAVRVDLIHRMSQSQVGHCALSHRGIVMDAGISGTIFAREREWAAKTRTLLCMVPVPVEPIDLDAMPIRAGFLRSALRVLTLGRTRSGDCTCCARRALIAGGVPVPTYIVSPKQLHDWLLDRGYPHVRIEPVRTPAGQVCGPRGKPGRMVPTDEGFRLWRAGFDL